MTKVEQSAKPKPARYSISIVCPVKKKEDQIPRGLRCSSVETCCNVCGVPLSAGKGFRAEARTPKPTTMATLSLRNIKKIYPHANNGKKKKASKKGEAPSGEKANLEVTSQGVVAVQQFSLDIADKEFIVLVGPSGCGKSTTLRMVAGLEEISEGELYIDDKLMNDVEPKDRDIAMVFQSYALYPHMTVYENMAFPLKLRKMPKDEIDRKVKEAAATLDITQYLNRKPKALSGGQRQRVAIGRAIVREPKVLLMDEPLSNLDAKLRNQMRSEIIKLRQKIDTTFMYVTHDQTEAMTLGDRIVVMKDGVVQQIATPQEVFNHPANIFVAGFIGVPQMNFFDAQLVRSGEGFTVKTDDMNVALAPETCAQLALNWDGDDMKEITAGVRPEQILLADKGEEGALQGTVEVTELMGSTEHVHVTAPDGQFVLIIPVVDLEAKGALKAGDTIWFKFEKNATHLFDKVSGKNLI